MNPGEVTKPAVTKELAVELASRLYGFDVVSIKEMVSFDDKNFHIKVSEQHRNPHVGSVMPGGYTLKVTNTAKSAIPGHFESMHLAMKHLHSKGLCVPQPVENLHGLTWSLQEVPLLQRGADEKSNDGPTKTGMCGVHLLTYIEGAPVCSREYTADILHQWGHLLARVHNALQDFSNDVMYRKEIFWNIEHVPEITQFMNGLSEEKRSLISRILDQYEDEVAKILPSLPSGYIHGDFNENNVLIRKVDPQLSDETARWVVEGILDLEDMHYGTYAWDVAMMLAYVSLDCKTMDPFEGMGHALAGYLCGRSMSEKELTVLKMFIMCRLCQSLVLGAYCFSLEPQNTYLIISGKTGWDRLKLILETSSKSLLEQWRNIAASHSVAQVA